ncbi:MAG: hypothetical protein EXR12_02450 [Rhodospirillaceae bacterium]|nr:hypothetical protein [Rhodospirillaceae bacterium]
MNEPNESGAQTYVLPEIHFTLDGQHAVEPTEETAPPAASPPVQVTPQEPLPEGPAPSEPVVEEPPSVPPSDEEPPIERHDPFAYMRNAPWMDRRLSPSGRGAILLRRDLDAFPVIEGRDPNLADLEAIAKRTVDYIAPIIKREQLTDYAYEVLEEKRQARIAKRQSAANETDRPAQGFIKVSGGSPDLRPGSKSTPPAEGFPAEVGPSLAQLGPEARNERIRAQEWSEPSGDREYLKSLEQFRGRAVRLPDGSRVPDPYSPTGDLMSPVEDLSRVARAGRAARSAWIYEGIAIAALTPENLEKHYKQVYAFVRSALAQGGEFDYQRKAALGEKSGFVQLRQFRNVSNFNVGLFMQQAAFPLEGTLWALYT